MSDKLPYTAEGKTDVPERPFLKPERTPLWLRLLYPDSVLSIIGLLLLALWYFGGHDILYAVGTVLLMVGAATFTAMRSTR